MAEDVKVTRQSEETVFDDNGKATQSVRVEFRVGADGPFVRHFPKDGFQAFQVKTALEDFARELRNVRGIL